MVIGADYEWTENYVDAFSVTRQCLFPTVRVTQAALSVWANGPKSWYPH